VKAAAFPVIDLVYWQRCQLPRQ